MGEGPAITTAADDRNISSSAAHRGAGGARLSGPVLAVYGSPAIVLALMAVPQSVYLPAIYSEVVGLPLYMVGALLLVSRLSDVVTDVWIGSWSDATKGRFGRRKPFLVVGAPLFMVAAYLLFLPPSDATAAYLLAALVLNFLAYTLIDIPHRSWGAEMSMRYDERSRIAGWREWMTFLGVLLAFTIPLVVERVGEGGLVASTRVMAWFMIVGIAISVALNVALVPEPPTRASGRRMTFPEGARLAWSNRALRYLIGIYMLIYAAQAMGGSLGYFIVSDYFGRGDLFEEFLFVYIGFALFSIPAWVWFAKKYDKKRALAVSVVLHWAGQILLVVNNFMPYDADTKLVVLFSLLPFNGFTAGAHVAMIHSMAADVVDFDTMTSGKQRTGLYFAILGMAQKSAYAIGTFAGTGLAAYFGFDPGAETNSPFSLLMVLVLGSAAPATIILMALPLALRFPITRRVQEEWRQRIEKAESN